MLITSLCMYALHTLHAYMQEDSVASGTARERNGLLYSPKQKVEAARGPRSGHHPSSKLPAIWPPSLTKSQIQSCNASRRHRHSCIQPSWLAPPPPTLPGSSRRGGRLVAGPPLGHKCIQLLFRHVMQQLQRVLGIPLQRRQFIETYFICIQKFVILLDIFCPLSALINWMYRIDILKHPSFARVLAGQ